jgi:iron uptake system component EfeO
VRRSLAVLALTAAAGLAAGCADDGAAVRSETSSGSGSGSGLSGSDLGTQSADKEVQAAVAAYRSYVRAEAATLRRDAKLFTDAVRAGDVAEAKRRYAPSRVSWERIEPIAGLVEEIDGAVDARVDDFASVDDPKWTGWHRLEHLLWVRGTTEGGRPLADKLDRDLATLERQLAGVDITPKAVALGAGELIEEVSKGKITGEEDRYSRTDLWDFAANVEGSRKAYEVFAAVLSKKDAGLARTLDERFSAVEASLRPYRLPGGGYQPYTALAAADKARMQAQLGALSEELAKLPAALGVA